MSNVSLIHSHPELSKVAKGRKTISDDQQISQTVKSMKLIGEDGQSPLDKLISKASNLLEIGLLNAKWAKRKLVHW